MVIAFQKSVRLRILNSQPVLFNIPNPDAGPLSEIWFRFLTGYRDIQTASQAANYRLREICPIIYFLLDRDRHQLHNIYRHNIRDKLTEELFIGCGGA
jgi:hypothetical protein